MVEVDRRTLDMIQAFNKESERAKVLFNELRNETMRFNEQAGNAHVEATRISDAFHRMSQIPAFDEAKESFQGLKQTMDEVRDTDLSALGDSVAKLRKDMGEAMNIERPDLVAPISRAAESPGPPAITPAVTRTDAPAPVSHSVNIQTLRVDVSGVTDRTDKRRLADEISQMVTKSLKRKMGGPMTNTGYDRGA